MLSKFTYLDHATFSVDTFFTLCSPPMQALRDLSEYIVAFVVQQPKAVITYLGRWQITRIKNANNKQESWSLAAHTKRSISNREDLGAKSNTHGKIGMLILCTTTPSVLPLHNGTFQPHTYIYARYEQ